MEKKIQEFYCDNGALAFVIPFSFEDKTCQKNYCTRIFEKIEKECYGNNHRLKSEIELRDIYHNSKKDILERLRLHKLFRQSEEVLNNHCIFCSDTCGMDKNYKGRNLCECFSIGRKFHDDCSENTPRLEIYLGSYHVFYSFEEIDANDYKPFEFDIDISLLLDGTKGNECGYLLYSIPLKPILVLPFDNMSDNPLDKIIFLKHLFYKNRLKCKIDNKDQSLQQWTEEYIDKLLTALGIDTRKAVNEYVLFNHKKDEIGAAFRYSIIELDNLRDHNKKLISISNVEEFQQTYINQLYGLLVSDEGWRHIYSAELQSRFENNHWASRKFACSFFLDHNALVINQYSLKEKDEYQKYRTASKNWYQYYTQSADNEFYEKYPCMQSCLPGVRSLTLFVFLKTICKEMLLERAIDLNKINKWTIEKRYKYLANMLQKYSMSLDAIKNVEDLVSIQFGMPTKINDIREMYQREANNMQNQKVKILTVVTAFISLSSFCISTLALNINTTGNPQQNINIYARYFEATEWILLIATLVALGIFLAMVVQLFYLLKKH